MTEFSAEDALEARQRDPHAAIRMAREVLSSGVSADEASVAERAIGLSLRELHDFTGSLRHLRRSIKIASSPRLAALARVSLAWVLSYTGKHTQALRAIDLAMPELHGEDADHARMQRGVVFHYLCRYEDAQRDYTFAIEGARRTGDHLGEARARNNRGLVRAYVGGLRGAAEDFAVAASLYESLGQDLAVADVHWNAGIMATRGGDVPGAMTKFDQADEVYRRLDVPRPALTVNRLELLVSVPLLDEARVAADRAIAEMRSRKLAFGLSEALFFRARVALLDGEPDAATGYAAEARKGFRREQRRLWEAGARYLELHAAFLRGDRTSALRVALTRVADELDRLDWRLPALEARVDAGLVAVDLGQVHRAREQFSVAASARRRGPAALRVHGWYAEALRRKVDGDVRGTSSALRRGLSLLDEYRVSLGAADLRALSGAQGKALALEGLHIAVASRRADRVLAWTESWRAGALRMTPVSPPDDPRLEDAMGELRSVSADLEGALLAGRPSGSLRARQVRLEQQVRDLTRQVSGGGAVLKPPTLAQLTAALDSASAARSGPELSDLADRLDSGGPQAAGQPATADSASTAASGPALSDRVDTLELGGSQAAAKIVTADSASTAASGPALSDRVGGPQAAGQVVTADFGPTAASGPALSDRADTLESGGPQATGQPATADSASTAASSPALSDLADRLESGGPQAGAALIEYVHYDAALLAVVVADGRATLHELGAIDDAVREIRLLRFALQRLVTLPPNTPNRGVARSSATHAAKLLTRRLLAPLEARVDGRPLVVIPTGTLNGMPWAVLGRQVTVAPSAAVWLRSSTVATSGGTAVLAAGPNLAAAPAEIEAVSGHVPSNKVLIGDAATVSAVASAMDGASLAHVAAHGSFRADNPLFSALELADGPLTVYDLERLHTPPSLVVLSACDTGQSAVRPGDELMGFTAALLGLGTRTLIAPVVPVPTDGTAPVMVELHRRLAAGASPSEALASVQSDDDGYEAAIGFVCFGAG